MIKFSRRVIARYAADQLLAGISSKEIAEELAAVLIEQKAQGQAEQLAADVRYELEHRGQLTIVEATSARPLSDSLKTEIEAAVKQATETRHIEMETSIDKSVLGGVRLETASRVWDQTLKTKLAKLREVA